jgi:hypothetical protein
VIAKPTEQLVQAREVELRFRVVLGSGSLVPPHRVSLVLGDSKPFQTRCSQRKLCFGVAFFGRGQEPHCSFFIRGRSACATIPVQERHFEECIGVPLYGCLLEPLHRIEVALRYASAVQVH